MKSITLNQRRFLIVWICINAFALFVNVAHIEGRIRDENVVDKSIGAIVTIDDKTICLFEDNNHVIAPATKTFYPFTTNFTLIVCDMRIIDGVCYYNRDVGFLGIFNGYSYLEFIVYILLGFAIIYLPKMWNRGK